MSGRERVLILILGLLVAFAPLSIDMYLPALPAMSRALGAEPSTVQLTLTSFFVGFALGQLIYGPISDRLGRRRVLISGLILFIAASALCVVAQSVEVLALYRFFQALGGGAASVLARSMVRDIYSGAAAARVQSYMIATMAIAPLVAPTIGGQLLLLGDWRLIFMVLTAIGLIAFTAVLARISETTSEVGRAGISLAGAFGAYGVILADRRGYPYLVCAAGTFAALFAYITATPDLFIGRYGVSAQSYGLYFGLNILGMMVGAYGSARLVGRFTVPHILIAGVGVGVLGAAALFAFALADAVSFPILLACLFLSVGCVATVGANSLTMLLDSFPRNAGAAAALYGASQFMGGGLASVIVSAATDGTPWPLTVTLLAAFAIAILGLLLAPIARAG